MDNYFANANFGQKHLGQTMTRQDLADMVVAQTLDIQEGEESPTICDPCCGSGRLLLAAGRLVPNVLLYGIDIDCTMAKMSVINLALFGMRGLIICGDIFDIQPGPLSECEFRVAYEVGFTAPGMLRMIPADKE